MKILITEPEYFPHEIMKPLEKLGKLVEKRTSYEELLEEIRDTDVLIVRVQTKVDKKILDNAKRLKIIASMTTGLDHIDVEHAEKMGIEIVSMPGYATTATAEYTMSLILNMLRKLPWAFEHCKNGKWERYNFLGSDLGGKTVGIIGFGKIGSRVAKYTSGFGAKVIFYDPYINRNELENTDAEQVQTIDELLKKSDIITIHTYLSKDTTKMIRKQQFSKMKKGAILINASRGLLVDESDLVDALEDGTLSGAALDAFEEEPLPPSHRLINYARTHKNLILTPHIAGSTRECIDTAARFVVDSVLKRLADN